MARTNTNSNTSAGVTSVSNLDGTLIISPNTGLVIASVNTAHNFGFTGEITLNPAVQTAPNDAATIGQLASFVSGLAWKSPPAQASSTANVNIAAPASAVFDGHTVLNGQTVLIQFQTINTENGIYVFNGVGVPMTRRGDANTSMALTGATISVLFGTMWGGNSFTQITNMPNIGVDPIIFTEIGILYAAGTGLLLTGNVFSINPAYFNGLYATRQLDNLSATAINVDLLPGVDDTINLGNATHRFRQLVLGSMAGVSIISGGNITTATPALGSAFGFMSGNGSVGGGQGGDYYGGSGTLFGRGGNITAGAGGPTGNGGSVYANDGGSAGNTAGGVIEAGASYGSGVSGHLMSGNANGSSDAGAIQAGSAFGAGNGGDFLAGTGGGRSSAFITDNTGFFQGGALILVDGSGNKIQFNSPASILTPYTMIFPSAPSAGVLTYDGISTLTFVPAATGTVTSVNGTPNRITSTGGANPVIDISAVFEALLGKVASPLSQFAATTSAQLAGVITDETGTGFLVFNTSPAFLGNPTAPTQLATDNSTRLATTAFAEPRAISATAALNFPNTAARSSSDLTIPLAGAVLNDVIALGVPNSAVLPNSCYTAWVSAAGVVTVRFNNYTNGALNPVAGNFTVKRFL